MVLLTLDRNPLHFIQCDLVTRAIVELGGARALMRGYELRVLQRAAVIEIGGDPGGPEGVAAHRSMLHVGVTTRKCSECPVCANAPAIQADAALSAS